MVREALEKAVFNKIVSGDWNFGSADQPRDLSDFLSDFNQLKQTDSWLRNISSVDWTNFFLVCDLDNLSRKARELLINYCLRIVADYAGKFKSKPTLDQIEDAMDRDYVEEYDNPIYHFKFALRDKIIHQAVATAANNRYSAPKTGGTYGGPARR